MRENCGETVGCTEGRLAERELWSDNFIYRRNMAERELWSDSWMHSRTSGEESIVERQFDVQKEDWLRENCGVTVGFTAGRVAEREMWSDSWMYIRASG